jgi:hypothetical protein
MNKYQKIIGYGILIWLLVFIVSFIIFPIHDTNRPLFESIIPITLTTGVLLFTILYFKNNKKFTVQEGIQIGIIWFIINIIIDLILFLPESPMQMTPPDYFMDIGLTYLIIIIIPIGIGYLITKITKK